MSEAMAIVELVAFERLTGGVSLAPVFQDVPEDTMPPVVIIGDIDKEGLTDDADDPDCRVKLSIVTVTSGSERKPCLDIQFEIETSLAGHRVSRDGISLLFRLVDADAVLAGDGEGYVGTSRFEIMALHD